LSVSIASGILGDMSADRSLQHDDVSEPEILDLDAGDAFLRWAETAAEPEGIDLTDWLRWNRSTELDAEGVPIPHAMLPDGTRAGVLP
jgi:hypothetical protein